MTILNKHNAASAQKGVLKTDEVLRIKQGLERGDHPNLLARLFGVSEQTITRIRDGKTWGWLRTDKEMMDRPVVGKVVPEGVVSASLQDVLKRINEGKQAEGGGGLDALNQAVKEVKKGDRMLKDLIGDRAEGLRGETK